MLMVEKAVDVHLEGKPAAPGSLIAMLTIDIDCWISDSIAENLY